MSKYALKKTNFPLARIRYQGSSKSIPSNLLKEFTPAQLKILYTYKYVVICSAV